MSSDISMEQVRKFFSWQPVPLPDEYTWEGEVRQTGQTKWVRNDNGFWLGTRGGSAPHAYDQWLLNNTSLLTDDSLRIVNYGELNGGRQAYVQVATEQTQEVAGVEYRSLITASSSMDGSFASAYGRGEQIIICMNTFQMARNESARDNLDYRVKATKNSKFNVLDARTALKVMFDDADAFGAEIRALTSEHVSDPTFLKFVEAYAPAPEEKGRAKTLAEKKQEMLLDLWRDDERVAPWRGTKFGVHQAVNTYVTHLQTVKGQTREDSNMLKTMHNQWSSVAAEAEKILASVS